MITYHKLPVIVVYKEKWQKCLVVVKFNLQKDVEILKKTTNGHNWYKIPHGIQNRKTKYLIFYNYYRNNIFYLYLRISNILYIIRIICLISYNIIWQISYFFEIWSFLKIHFLQLYVVPCTNLYVMNRQTTILFIVFYVCFFFLFHYMFIPSVLTLTLL